MLRRLLSFGAALLVLVAIAFALTLARPCCGAGASATRTATLDVQGMTCGACATSVKVVLMKLDGVSEAKVSVEDKSAVVSYDPAKVSPEKMVETIHAKLPYKAKVVDAARAK